MTSLAFTKTAPMVYETGELTERGIYLQVWRREPGSWGWSLVWPSGIELPADEGMSSRHQAMRAAAAWWQQHGGGKIDYVTRLYLGERTRFLANTSERTKKPSAAERIAAAKAKAEAEPEPKAETVEVAADAIKLRTAHGTLTVEIDDDRLSMVADLATERQAHSVMLDYRMETQSPRDRALIHLAGFMRMHGATDAQIAVTLATVDNFDRPEAAAEITKGEAAQIAVGLAELRRTQGKACSSPGRGGYVARLVAWHVGIAGADLLA